MNKPTVFLLGGVTALILQTFIWTGWSESYELQPMVAVKENCFQYSDDESVKNIARHAIIHAANGLPIELLAQKRLTLANLESGYYLGGWPYHLSILFYRLTNTPYIPTIGVWLEKDQTDKCLYIREVLYQKD